MASALDMVAGVGQFGFDPLGDIYEGRKTRYATNEMNRADQARPLMGQALQGDSNALNSLAGVDPQGFMEVSGFQDKRAQSQAEQAAQEAAKVARLIEWADTPEKWSQATQRIQSMGHELEPQEMDFNNRGMMLAEYQATQKGEPFTLGEGQMRFGPNGEQIAAGPPKSQSSASSLVVTDIDGQRGILNKETGQFTPKGKSPIRGKPGLSPTEFKAKRESENDLLNLGQTIKSLERAADLSTQTFEGTGAGAKAYIGSKLPGGSLLVDQTGADATTEYTSLMSPEAIKEMAATLKGATTDFELRKFESILSDPSQPNTIKIKVIDRMLALARNRHDLESRRLQEFDERENGGQTQAAPGEIPTQAVEELLADPSGAAEFDEVFGIGAAAQVLGQ